MPSTLTTVGQPMRIATWNLKCARPGSGSRSERIRAVLASVAPDVLVLTESHPGFVPAPGYVRRAMSAEAPDRVNGGRWVVMWTRPEILAAALPVASEPERSAAIRIDRPIGCAVLVFGTVLPWRGDKRNSGVSGGRAFARSLHLQMNDWLSARTTAPEAQLCVAGDFNQEVDAVGPVGTRVGRTALDETLRRVDLTCVTGGARDPLLARGWRASIDHIAVSRGIRSDSLLEVWPNEFPLSGRLSDHYGVCATLFLT